MTKLEQAARQALEALSDCVDDSRTVLSQNEQIYTERYRPHVLIEQERVVKDAETAIAALHEALSGVQALSAAQAIGDELRDTLVAVSSAIAERDDRAAQKMIREILATSPTPPEEQQATKETSGGFHVWRDISTAPKDGSRFVATGHNYGLYSEVRHTCVAQWFRGCWMEASDWNETSELKYLTHWMPLPSPPDDVAAPADQQAPKAAPVVWLSSKQLRGVTALHGQYLPFRCQPEGRFDTPVYLVEAAPKAAPGEQNTVPAEWLEQAYREGWAACRDAETIGEEAEDWAFGNSTANSRMIDAQQAAPQQEPSRDAKTWCSYVAGMIGCYLKKPDESAEVRAIAGIIERRLWALPAPQPAPAPLSDDAKDAARYRWLREGNDAKHGAAWHVAVNLYGCEWDAAIDAALAAQGGKA